MRIIAVAVCAVGLSGCASVVRGTDEQISFQSNPTAAHLALSNGLSCPETPCELKVQRKDDFTATFTKDGYQPESVRVVSHVSGSGVAAGAGNLLLGGIVGVGVDAYTGANLDHTPNPVITSLLPIAPTKPVKGSTKPAPVS